MLPFIRWIFLLSFKVFFRTSQHFGGPITSGYFSAVFLTILTNSKCWTKKNCTSWDAKNKATTMIYHSQHSRTGATSARYYENLPITWTYANKILDSGGQGHQQWSNLFQFRYVYATYLKRISYHVLHHCIFILSSYYRIISGWCVDKLL